MTHATVTHPEGHLGSGLTSSGLHGGTPPADDMSCNAPARTHWPIPRVVPAFTFSPCQAAPRNVAAGIPETLERTTSTGSLMSLLPQDTCMRTSCQSPSGRTAGSHSSRISKTKTPASGLRQALLGRIRFGKPPLLGYVRRQKERPGLVKSVTVITTWIIATGSEQKISAEFNSCLLGPQRLKHFAISYCGTNTPPS